MRRTAEQSAERDVADVLRSLPLEVVAPAQGPMRADLTVQTADGRHLILEVKALASPAPADVDRLARAAATPETVRVLVADRIVPRVREQLRNAGWSWLDRRGHFFLLAPGLLIDSDIAPLRDERATRARPVLDTDVGIDVATAILTESGRKLSIRALVAFTGRSLGAVHHAVRSLTEEGLVGPHGLPLVPELFWEVAARWRPLRVPLAASPDPDDHRNGQGPDGEWVLCDTLAASAFGAAPVIRGDYPPDFYVPDARTVRVARQLFGDPLSADRRAATVAVAPATWTCARSVGPVGAEMRWPAAHPVVVALDLAIDAGRGREILDGWTPPEPFTRVW
jgi:hypothetical protein